MFEEFSGGYYLGRLYVQPSPEDRALLHRHQYDRVTDELYDEDVPVVMKVDDTHITVHGTAGVPGDTLLVPESVIEESRIRNPPSLEEVLLAKAPHARQLLRLHGHRPST